MTTTRPTQDKDAATQGPVLAFLVSSLVWLLLAGMLSLIASAKLHAPRFLASSAWLTFGRVRPAQESLMLYGWASMAGAAVLIGLTAWLSSRAPRFPGLLIVAASLWDLAVLEGTLGILAGGRTGIPWLEYPAGPASLIAIASIVVGASTAVSLLGRSGAGDPPRSYLLAAAFGFVWLETTAAWLTVIRPVGGITESVIAAWYADGLSGLWFAAIGLAVLYAMLPPLVNRPIANRRVASLGFWSLVTLCVWAGGRRLVGGPVPAWVVTVAIVAGVLLVIHLASIAINLLPMLTARPRPRTDEPARAFLIFAVVAYLASGVLQAVGSLRSVSRILHFTHAEDALAQLGLFGFFSMAIFGAVYRILPRLSGRGWTSRWAIRAHFWCSAGGVVLYASILTAAGLVQGLALRDATVPIVDIGRRMTPFLIGGTAALGLMVLGTVFFVLAIAGHLMVGRTRRAERRRNRVEASDGAARGTSEHRGGEAVLIGTREERKR